VSPRRRPVVPLGKPGCSHRRSKSFQTSQYVQITGLVGLLNDMGNQFCRRFAGPQLATVPLAIAGDRLVSNLPLLAKLVTTDCETDRNKQKVRLITRTNFVVTVAAQTRLAWATAQRGHDGAAQMT